LQGDVTGGYDAQVFGDSQRPTEPLHAGMPFGPGPNFLPEPGQDPHQFLLTVAQGLESSPTTDRVKMLAARIRLGE
jgi:hypothetical protein